MPGGASFVSDALFYWMRTNVEHKLIKMTSPNPFSCTLEQKLCVTKNGSTCDSSIASLAEIFITFTAAVDGKGVPTDSPTIKINEPVNKYSKHDTKFKLMYEASLQEASLMASN